MTNVFAVFCLRGGIIVDIIEIIVETLVGILCFFCAFQIGINKKLELLHAYHYKNIKSENINIFCKKISIGLAVVGLGMILMPAVNSIFKTNFGYWIGIILLSVSVIYMLCIIVKYNKTIFKKT